MRPASTTASTWARPRPRSRRRWSAATGTIYRYNPDTGRAGQEPFTLDSKEPKAEGYQDFIKGEVRYASLAKLFPDVAQDLFNKNEADAMAKYAKYKRLAE